MASGAGAEGDRSDRERLAASGVWTGATTGSAYTVDLQLLERRRQREHHRFARLRGPRPHRRRSRERAAAATMYRQFNAAAFQGPLNNSVGLESSNDYLSGCFTSALDLAIARNIRLGGAATCSSAWRCSTRRTSRASPAAPAR